ncbi:hypothetical protein Hanom_Chr15g01406751 [Helianthus anomalus]
MFLPEAFVDALGLTCPFDSVTELESTSSAFAASTLSAIFPRFSAVNSCVVSIMPVSTIFDFSISSFSFFSFSSFSFLFLFFNHLLSWRSPPLVLPVLIFFFVLLDDGFDIKRFVINRNVTILIKVALSVWIPSICSSRLQKYSRNSDNLVFSNHFPVSILLILCSIIFPRNGHILCHESITDGVFFR